jgi:hypothetical protein
MKHDLPDTADAVHSQYKDMHGINNVMTKTAKNASLTIRLDKKKKHNWKAKASKTGMSLTGLICYVMDNTDVSLIMVAKRDEQDRARIEDEPGRERPVGPRHL